MRKALVVHSMGLDELTPMGPADVVEVAEGQPLRRYSLDPRDVGIPRCSVEDLKGGDAALNAQILRDVFAGQLGECARRTGGMMTGEGAWAGKRGGRGVESWGRGRRWRAGRAAGGAGAGR